VVGILSCDKITLKVILHGSYKLLSGNTGLIRQEIISVHHMTQTEVWIL